VFKKVVTALEDALADAKSAQQANDDEFAKVKCKADEKIKEANERIPVHQQKIAESKARQAEIRAENEELSIAAADLDASVRKLTKELADKQAKRDADKLAYQTKSGDMNVGVDMMKKSYSDSH
jgi:chromosome segregation ATPase